MPSSRNVHFLDGLNNEVAGLWQNGSIVWDDILEWMHIVLDNPVSSYAIFPCVEEDIPENPTEHHGPLINLADNQNVVDPGYYVVLAQNGSLIEIVITLETAPARTTSYSLSKIDPRTAHFTDRVRARDRCCVVSGIRVPGENYRGFDAAHVFPLAHLDLWHSGRWTEKVEDDHPEIGESKIHSIQNGILLNRLAHSYFDAHSIAIDPDKNNRITCFVEDAFSFDGRYAKLDNDYPPQDQPLRSLLKHHFRMAVIYNMKGKGPDYEWDDDITPGTDQIHEISQSKHGKLRFETVMAERLNSLLA